MTPRVIIGAAGGGMAKFIGIDHVTPCAAQIYFNLSLPILQAWSKQFPHHVFTIDLVECWDLDRPQDQSLNGVEVTQFEHKHSVWRRTFLRGCCCDDLGSRCQLLREEQLEPFISELTGVVW